MDTTKGPNESQAEKDAKEYQQGYRSGYWAAKNSSGIYASGSQSYVAGYQAGHRAWKQTFEEACHAIYDRPEMME